MIKKRRKANAFGLFFLIFFSSLGGLFVYRTGISEEEFRTYEGVLENAEIQEGFGKYGRRYAILLKFKKSENILGIYGGTKKQVTYKFQNLKLIPGTNYKVFIDPTVINSLGGVNLGVRKIKYKNKNIYIEYMKSTLIFGWMFIFLGIISFITFYVLAKIRFKEK